VLKLKNTGDVKKVTGKPAYYVMVPSAFGTLGIVWRGTEENPKVHRLFLPEEKTPVEDIVQRTFAGASPLSCPAVAELEKKIQSFLEGADASFELNIITLEECSEFQKRVLLAEYQIPRGWVSTYGRIAQSLGIPGSVRAVGRALARNPFPIIIPCHRAVRSSGELGGFQGGLGMKRALLEREGVEFSKTGRVLTNRLYY